MKNIKTIAFDADDTLWINEPYFRAAEQQFHELMADYLPKDSTPNTLLQAQIKNLPLYGYGIKSFTLSMIEAAIDITNKTVPLTAIVQMLDIGKEMLEAPVELLDGVEEVLQALQGKYR